MATLGQG